MAKEDELVQVSISLPKSHVSILPELMKVVATACSSSYCWDSMKLSVNSEVPSDKGSRMIVNLGKRVTSESEVIQGMIHKCRDSVCKHTQPSQDLVGEVRMTSFTQKTLKEHLKETPKSDEDEIEGTGWLKKDVSDEMFYPSWYDELRMKSVQQLGDDHFPERHLPPSSPVLIVNNVNVHNFYESENDEYFTLKHNPTPVPNKLGQVSDETFRLKKVCDRAKNFVEPELNRIVKHNIKSETPLDMKKKIRELKERLDPSDMCDESFFYIRDRGRGDSKEKDYSYRQYLCYDEDLPPYPICDTDDSSLVERRLDELPRDSYQPSRELQETFMREYPKIKTIEQDEILKKTIRKTKIQRSFSANAIPQGFEGSRELSPSKRKKEERKRPKSGPEKRVDFIASPEADVFGRGDSSNICGVQHRTINRTTTSRKKTEAKELIEVQDQPRDKKKKRKSRHNSEKDFENAMVSDHRELASTNHIKRVKEKGQAGDENEIKGTKLVISYKSYDEDLVESRSNHRRHDHDESRADTKHHRKSRKSLEEKTDRSDQDPRSAKKHDEKNESKRSRGKDEPRKSKRPKSERDDHHKTKQSDVLRMDYDTAQNDQSHKHVKEKGQNPESTRSWKRGFLGKRGTIGDESQPTADEHVSIELDEKTSKRALSFLEIISVMADEVKQLGKRRDNKRVRDKVS